MGVLTPFLDKSRQRQLNFRHHPLHSTTLLFTPAVVDLNMLMCTVADDAIPITNVLSHCVVSVERYKGLVKSGASPTSNVTFDGDHIPTVIV